MLLWKDSIKLCSLGGQRILGRIGKRALPADKVERLREVDASDESESDVDGPR